MFKPNLPHWKENTGKGIHSILKSLIITSSRNIYTVDAEIISIDVYPLKLLQLVNPDSMDIYNTK